MNRRSAIAAGVALAAVPAAALADGIEEWCPVDPKVFRVDGHTYQVWLSVRPGYQRYVHDIIVTSLGGGVFTVQPPLGVEVQSRVVRVN